MCSHIILFQIFTYHSLDSPDDKSTNHAEMVKLSRWALQQRSANRTFIPYLSYENREILRKTPSTPLHLLPPEIFADAD